MRAGVFPSLLFTAVSSELRAMPDTAREFKKYSRRNTFAKLSIVGDRRQLISDTEDCQMALKILCKELKCAALSIHSLCNHRLQCSVSKATDRTNSRLGE